MSVGHRRHPVTDEHRQELEQALADPKFAAALAAYKNEDDSHDIPFLGGSDNAGKTIYFDRKFNNAVKAGKIKYGGQPYDPRPFVRVHEAVEGALIRLHGLDYTQAHDIATAAEKHAVEATGRDWNKHQNSMRNAIKISEAEKAKNPPPDLLKVPYEGTPQAKKVGEKKLSHAAVKYGPGHKDGDRCGVCQHYEHSKPPHCELVVDPMNLGVMGWCNKFEKKAGTVNVHSAHPILRQARRSPKDGKLYVPDNSRPGKYMLVT